MYKCPTGASFEFSFLRIPLTKRHPPFCLILFTMLYIVIFYFSLFLLALVQFGKQLFHKVCFLFINEYIPEAVKETANKTLTHKWVIYIKKHKLYFLHGKTAITLKATIFILIVPVPLYATVHSFSSYAQTTWSIWFSSCLVYFFSLSSTELFQ